MTHDLIVLLCVCPVLPGLQHVKRSKAAYSVIFTQLCQVDQETLTKVLESVQN